MRWRSVRPAICPRQSFKFQSAIKMAMRPAASAYRYGCSTRNTWWSKPTSVIYMLFGFFVLSVRENKGGARSRKQLKTFASRKIQGSK